MESALVVIGLDHHTAPLEVRERFWMDRSRQADAISSLSQAEGVDEILVFSTCQRTEFVAWGDATLAVNSVLRFLTAQYNLKLCEWNCFHRLLEEQALVHAFRVSCGLDSTLVGEDQITRQVTAAWQQARTLGTTGRFLDAVLRKALGVRRRVRKETALSSCLVTASETAAALAEKTLGPLADRRVVVLGAGRLGQLCVQTLTRRGVRAVCVINRTEARALELAKRYGVQTRAYENHWTELAAADLVISASAHSECLIAAADARRVMSERQGRELLLIDLALPRNIEPGVRELAGIVLYDLQDLARHVEPFENLNENQVTAEAIVLEEVRAFKRELATEVSAPAILALRQRLDEICRQELECFRVEQGPFPKDQDQLLAAVSARITHRIAGSLVKEKGFRLQGTGSRP